MGAFDMFDRDKDGIVSHKEYHMSLRDSSKVTASSHIDEHDTDKDGKISWYEYLSMVRHPEATHSAGKHLTKEDRQNMKYPPLKTVDHPLGKSQWMKDQMEWSRKQREL